jgi:hypothetical protein
MDFVDCLWIFACNPLFSQCFDPTYALPDPIFPDFTIKRTDSPSLRVGGRATLAGAWPFRVLAGIAHNPRALGIGRKYPPFSLAPFSKAATWSPAYFGGFGA